MSTRQKPGTRMGRSDDDILALICYHLAGKKKIRERDICEITKDLGAKRSEGKVMERSRHQEPIPFLSWSVHANCRQKFCTGHRP